MLFNMLKNICFTFICGVFLLAVSNCGRGEHEVLVGTTAGLYQQLLSFAQNEALRKDNLQIDIVVKPPAELNKMLAEGKLDANFFQTSQALKLYNQQAAEPVREAAKTYITPMAVYSKNRANTFAIENNDFIYLPRYAPYQSIALQLLQQTGLAIFKKRARSPYRLSDVGDTGAVKLLLKTVDISALSSASLKKEKVNAILLYPNQALALGFTEKQSIYNDSISNNNALVLAVSMQAKDSPKLRSLLAAIRSDEVQKMIQPLLGYQLNNAF